MANVIDEVGRILYNIISALTTGSGLFDFAALIMIQWVVSIALFSSRPQFPLSLR